MDKMFAGLRVAQAAYFGSAVDTVAAAVGIDHNDRPVLEFGLMGVRGLGVFYTGNRPCDGDPNKRSRALTELLQYVVGK